MTARVAIIGTGVSGLAVAKYLRAEHKFDITIYEQRAALGGIWNITGVDDEFATPTYDDLETNVPRSLMAYSDFPWPADISLFPKHEVVKEYLQHYAHGLEISYNAEVCKVREVIRRGTGKQWQITTRNPLSGRTTVAKPFDRVVVATGVYSKIYVPMIEGLEDWIRCYPGSVSHSKTYRKAEDFADKNVLIIGNNPSGWDISFQLATLAHTVLVSTLATPQALSHQSVISVGEVREFVSRSQTVRFMNSSVARHVDAVIFCTGYQYTFPFLQKHHQPIFPDGFRVPNLYENIFYVPDKDQPTLAFVGLPKMTAPFITAEAQSAVVARVFADRLAIAPAAMSACRDAEEKRWRELVRRGQQNTFHNMRTGEVEYVDRLYRWSMSATHAREGKIPPRWTDHMKWARVNTGAIRTEFRSKGEDRHRYTSVEDLGFYHAPPAEDGMHSRRLKFT